MFTWMSGGFASMCHQWPAPHSLNKHVCILTPWFSHPVSLWHWDHRRAAWQRWLSARFGPSAGQTFPVLCGAGSHTSVAIPAKGEKSKIFGSSCNAYFKTYFIPFIRYLGYSRNNDMNIGCDKQYNVYYKIASWMLCICVLQVYSDN